MRGSTLTANLSEAMAKPIPKTMPNITSVIAAPKSNSMCFSKKITIEKISIAKIL
jgi:hypothetical protein